jgi:uncharacterized membrane protein YjgN (DUF898 family)
MGSHSGDSARASSLPAKYPGPADGQVALPPPPPAAAVVYAATPYAQPWQQPPIVRAFYFDGGAASYLGTALLALLITFVTLGFGTPWAICLRYSWRTKHTYVNGHRLRFTGSGGGLFGNWVKWFLLMLITLGIYSFWVVPRLTKWIVEHQEFDPSYARQS